MTVQLEEFLIIKTVIKIAFRAILPLNRLLDSGRLINNIADIEAK